MHMRIGFIGLGRMGANMVRRLVRDGHEIVVFNRTPERTKEIEAEGQGAIASYSIEEMVGVLEKPRAVWVMVPAGDATEAQIEELLDFFAENPMAWSQAMAPAIMGNAVEPSGTANMGNAVESSGTAIMGAPSVNPGELASQFANATPRESSGVSSPPIPTPSFLIPTPEVSATGRV